VCGLFFFGEEMQNPHIAQRLVGIHAMLVGAHTAGAKMSSASKGVERATFVDKFLSEVLTPQFRFGEGDATDRAGNRSGQLDVVVEYPWIPSLPIVGQNRPRLYMAEGIAAVIEVKSDVASQWNEVRHTSYQLRSLVRQYGTGITMGPEPPPRVPLFAVGYTGWKTLASVEAHLAEGVVDGILVIDVGIFASADYFRRIRVPEGPFSLWCLISCLHQVTSIMSSTAADVPINYAI
jgi:hypothetical protein